MFFIVDACFFVMWFGAWSSCHGWGALGMSVLWTVVMGACLVTEVYGSLRRLWSLIAKQQLKPLIAFAVVVWALYFVGLGDGLNYLMPKTFPEGGVLFSPVKCGWLQCTIAIVWVIARLPFVRVMKWFIRLVKLQMKWTRFKSDLGFK